MTASQKPPSGPTRCCDGHHFEGCTDGGPGCCPRCPINPWEAPSRSVLRLLALTTTDEEATRG